jgi:hypothetical protein
MSTTSEKLSTWLKKAKEEILNHLISFKIDQSNYHWKYLLYLTGHSNKFLDEYQLLSALQNQGRYPPIINIGACGIQGKELFISVMPAGYEWVDDSAKTWKGVNGPFKVVPYAIKGFNPEESLISDALVENGRMFKSRFL